MILVIYELCHFCHLLPFAKAGHQYRCINEYFKRENRRVLALILWKDFGLQAFLREEGLKERQQNVSVHCRNLVSKLCSFISFNCFNSRESADN